MAIGFLKEAVTGEVPRLLAGIERMSVNQMALLVLDDAGYTEPENVEIRIWRPSLPVIHLATAIQLMLQLAEPYAGRLGLKRCCSIVGLSNWWFGLPNIIGQYLCKAVYRSILRS